MIERREKRMFDGRRHRSEVIVSMAIKSQRLRRFEKVVFKVWGNRAFIKTPVILLKSRTFPVVLDSKHAMPHQFLFRSFRCHYTMQAPPPNCTVFKVWTSPGPHRASSQAHWDLASRGWTLLIRIHLKVSQQPLRILKPSDARSSIRSIKGVIDQSGELSGH